MHARVPHTRALPANVLRPTIAWLIVVAASQAVADSTGPFTIRGDSVARSEDSFLFEGSVTVKAGRWYVRCTRAVARYNGTQLSSITVFNAVIEHDGARVGPAVAEAELAPESPGQLMLTGLRTAPPRSRRLEPGQIPAFPGVESPPAPGDHWTPRELEQIFRR